MKSDYSELQFNVQFDETPEENVPFQVVVFERSGNITYQAPVNEKSFSLPFSADDLRDKRVFLAPYWQNRETKLSLDTLEKGNGFEVSIPSQIDVEKPILINPIPKYIWCWWIVCFCNVRGRVFNHCDGEYMPVYKARVHICEVDPVIWYIQKLPDYEIFKLRDDLLAKIIDWHLPDPPPDPLRNIDINAATKFNTAQKNISVNPRSMEMNKASFATAGKNFTAPKLNTTQKEITANTANMQFDKSSLTTADKTIALSVLPQANIASFYSDSAYLVKNYLVANYQILYPYWCWLQPWFLHCDEVAVVETDNNGWFNTTVWYACCGDKPDLYFWVEYFINGAWTTVYNPGLHCGTHWDYVCNSEVDIYLHNESIPCSSRPPLIGKKVAVLTIGNNVNVSQVNSNTADVNFGLIQTSSPVDGTSIWAPFGGSLEPRVDFGDVLSNAGYLYKWSYSIHGANDWHPLIDSVVRHYRHETLSTLSYPAYPLGPVNGEYFHIQPVLTPDGNTHWVVVDSRTDTASAYFNTNALAITQGIYDLKLELFHADFTPVNFTAEGIDLFVADPAQDAPFGNQTVNTINAPANNLVSSGTDIVGFIMTVHVDNNATAALINETIDLTTGNAAGNCGMIEMSETLGGANDQIDISFIARHPNDFAVFNFVINKGSAGMEHHAYGNVSNIPPVTKSDKIGGVPEAYSYNAATSEFTTIKPAYKLLDGCAQAAFSEELYVYATATDGYSRLSGYDRSDNKAFALKS